MEASRGSGPKRYWTEERIIKSLQDFAEREGRKPNYSDTQHGGTARNNLPSGTTVGAVFGSWANGLIEAGFDPTQGWNKKDDETAVLSERVERGETVMEVAEDIGISRPALTRRIRRYREVYGLPKLALSKGNRRKK